MYERVKGYAKSVAVVAGGSLVGLSSAYAALPTAATDAIDAVETDGLALIAAIWPVAAAITGGLIVLSLFRRAIGKAT